MSAYNTDGFDRKRAVRLSAELLRGTGTAFFPLDIARFAESFIRQIRLTPYSRLRKAGDSESIDPKTLSADGFCTRVRNVLMDFGSGPVTGCCWNICYNDSAPKERLRFTLAAYNAGVGHVTDAMKLAQKYGKKPQVWYSNVEEAILWKMRPEFYNDPVCSFGYCRGTETLNYVRQVENAYRVFRAYEAKQKAKNKK